MKTIITKWLDRFFLIPSVSIKWNELDMDNNRQGFILSLDWLRWSLEMFIVTKKLERPCDHLWGNTFDSGYAQCKKCRRIEKPD